MLARLVLFALILIALSCATDEPLHFRFDDDTTDAERQATADSMAEWNAVTLDDHQLVVDPAGPWRITFTADDRVLPSALNGRTCGRYSDIERDCAFDHWIRVRRGNDPTTTRVDTEHELGHAMHLEHVGGSYVEGGRPMQWGDQHSIMTSPPGATALSSVDRTECLRAGACPSITIRTLPTE